KANWSFATAKAFVIRRPARERLFRLFPDSSAVEHSTVNRMVAGSNPAPGAKTHPESLSAHGDGQRFYRSPVTRQIASPTSSATSSEPSGPSVTPTGRP